VVSGLANHTLLVRRDGQRIPIEDSAAPITTGDGKSAGVVMVFRDVGERRRAEREQATLLESERGARHQSETLAQQLEAALQAGRMGTWQYTLADGGVSWSSGLEAIHGYATGTFPGTFEAFKNEIHPDDRDRLMQEIAAAIEQRRDHHVEYRIVRPDGGVRWVEGVGQLLVDAQGRPDRMVGVCTDVTERKQSEERFRLAVEAAPAAMFLVDEGGKIAYANALAERLLGYAQSELVGKSIEELVPRRLRAAHPQYRQRFLRDPRPRPMGEGRELFAQRKDGSEVPVEIGLSPFETPTGTLVLAAVTDITQRRTLEQQRAQLLEQEKAARSVLQRANRLREEFLAVLSHELRNPLNAVLGYVDLLLTGVLPAERSTGALEAIRRATESQQRLVTRLLDVSRIDAGKLELEREPIDLVEPVRRAVELVRPNAEREGVALEVELAAAPVMVNGDGGRLEQVFLNVLENAIKFTPRGGNIVVRLKPEDGAAIVEVSDSGQGIDADFLPHVFDRFKQAAGHERLGAGLGLGLALVRELVQAHGGAVSAASPGKGLGSTFTVTLPLWRPGISPDVATKRPPRERPSVKGTPPLS
jgi:PAS domain S-box-containing protein